MDPDQDLLDALDRKEGLSAAPVAAIIAFISIVAGSMAYFSLIAERFSGESSRGFIVGGRKLLIAEPFTRMGYERDAIAVHLWLVQHFSLT
jgi:hypothetical protein